MALHESAEMYLETIYELSQKLSSVRSIDVAETMGYSKPSVSRAVGLLKQGGYLLMDKDGFLTLTESGAAVATKIFERHTVLAKMLTALGVSKETAAEDACKIEHVISDETFDAIKNHLDQYYVAK
jgi:Mn-dependent DtxR family transcriptional regulator